ncbi:hypothetical protein [Saccharicrinis fermentans]|uniref:Uncharacterized protein n=1 Tax=Saccharicrinis fermentans DSM 9555 = JCM 21142 TaxID=869213 RepID=W7YLS3_9BACT|nr:hypothetical protein [Saccharicrinis fermentans]GAF05556.1 hypothetical protein JCM21142_104296 [Saccharicrinis fermentans DSM 9555 = JCM 21142]
MRKLFTLLCIVTATINVLGQSETLDKIIWLNSDGSDNTDPTYLYRNDDSKDAATLKLRMGDESSSLFEVGYNYYLESYKWYRNFSITGSGIGYFRTKLGIGTTSPQAKLHVSGDILAEEIRVEDIAANNLNLAGNLAANNIIVTANGETADFVFADDYYLAPLSEVENYILTHKHLPDIPSATQMEEQGVNLAEMNKLLLQKVEELTLYAIELDNAKSKEQKERENLEERLERLEIVLLNSRAVDCK